VAALASAGADVGAHVWHAAHARGKAGEGAEMYGGGALESRSTRC
jgi:hypothetical protein